MIKLLKSFRFVAYIENVENVHLSTTVKLKISLKTVLQKEKITERKTNGKQ